MKYQALFSSKDKSKNIKVLSAAILLGALRVNKHHLKIRNSHSCNRLLLPFSYYKPLKFTLIIS